MTDRIIARKTEEFSDGRIYLQFERDYHFRFGGLGGRYSLRGITVKAAGVTRYETELGTYVLPRKIVDAYIRRDLQDNLKVTLDDTVAQFLASQEEEEDREGD